MEELRNINSTLLVIIKDGKILLGEKKRGFAKGLLNGFGGKQDIGETIDETMIRETQEELGVTPVDYEKIGKIHFDVWYKGERVNMFVSVYKCSNYIGETRETDEMKPMWFKLDNIPYEKMFQDDLLWLPMAIKGEKFTGKVVFNKEMQMQSHQFEVCDSDKQL